MIKEKEKKEINKGNADGAVGIFGKCRARMGSGPVPRPTKKKKKKSFATLVRLVEIAVSDAVSILSWRVVTKSGNIPDC